MLSSEWVVVEVAIRRNIQERLMELLTHYGSIATTVMVVLLLKDEWNSFHGNRHLLLLLAFLPPFLLFALVGCILRVRRLCIGVLTWHLFMNTRAKRFKQLCDSSSCYDIKKKKGRRKRIVCCVFVYIIFLEQLLPDDIPVHIVCRGEGQSVDGQL